MRKMILSAIAMSLVRWLLKPKPTRAARSVQRKPARRNSARRNAT